MFQFQGWHHLTWSIFIYVSEPLKFSKHAWAIEIMHSDLGMFSYEVMLYVLLNQSSHKDFFSFDDTCCWSVYFFIGYSDWNTKLVYKYYNEIEAK